MSSPETSSSHTATAGTVFTITRRYTLPLATLWAAWSEATKLEKWWSPKGCTVDFGRFEFHPGGFAHFGMAFEGAPKSWGRFNYREIVPQQRLAWLNPFANEHCGTVRAPFSEACPMEILNTVTFTEAAGITTVALRAEPFGEAPAERQYFRELQPSLQEGYGGTFDQLGDFLQG